MIENKYKQKLSSLLGEIGERLVAYELIKRDWNVHKERLAMLEYAAL